MGMSIMCFSAFLKDAVELLKLRRSLMPEGKGCGMHMVGGEGERR